MNTCYRFTLVALAALVSGACQSSGGSFFFPRNKDLIIKRAEVKEVTPAMTGSSVMVEIAVRNLGNWAVVKAFRVGVVLRNPAFAPDPMKPAPDPDTYEELVIGLWSGPPFYSGQNPPLTSGIQVDMPINPKQTILLKRQLFVDNPWPGQPLELVVIADWNHEIAETNENNNALTIPF